MKLAPGTELLDDPAADPATVRRSLGHIARSNQLFGGRAAVLHGIARLLAGRTARSTQRPLTLLDIGTGAGDIPAAIRAWGARRGVAIRTLALERSRAAARLASSPRLPVALGCAGSLPVRARGVDIVVLSQVLHHLHPDSAVELLRALDDTARLGVVVADLRRSPTAATLFRFGSAILGFDEPTRTDGVTSIYRGYLRPELARLCDRAGVRAAVEKRWGWRVVAWWRATDNG